MDTGTVEAVIPVNRAAVLFLLLELAAVLAVVYWLPVPKPQYPGVVLSLLGAFAFYLVWPSIRTISTGVAVVLTDRGILNFTGGVTFVAWDEIKDARIGSPWGPKQVELVLRDEKAVLQRIGGLRGWSVRKYVQNYGGKPSIHAHFAKGGAEVVLSAIHKKLEAGRDAV